MLSKVNQITIYELSPAADEIWFVEKSDNQGYHEWKNGVVSFKDVLMHHVKIRPQVQATYAGGKATNVARILDRLLNRDADQSLLSQPVAPTTKFNVTLITFLPANPQPVNRPDGIVEKFTPGGIYIICLQVRDMKKINLCFQKLPATEKARADRRCINISDFCTGKDLLNFSPRLEWGPEEIKTVQDFMGSQRPEGLVLLAGTPPSGADCLYRDMIEAVRRSSSNVLVSVDSNDKPLQLCLDKKESHPDFIVINAEEYRSVKEYIWQQFDGTLLVHDKEGCWVWEGNGAKLSQSPDTVPYINVKQHEAKPKFGPATGPTIGAGDTVHAGFIFGWSRSKDVIEAAMYGQAVAAAAVRNDKGTRGMDVSKVEDYFRVIKSAGTTFLGKNH